MQNHLDAQWIVKNLLFLAGTSQRRSPTSRMTLHSLRVAAQCCSEPEQMSSACSTHLWFSSSALTLRDYSSGTGVSFPSSLFQLHCKNFPFSAICFTNHIFVFSNLKFFPFLIIHINNDWDWNSSSWNMSQKTKQKPKKKKRKKERKKERKDCYFPQEGLIGRDTQLGMQHLDENIAYA